MKHYILIGFLLFLGFWIPSHAQVEFASSANFPIGDVSPYGMKSGDFNNDGLDDVVTGNFTAGSITVLINNGLGGFNTTTFSTSGTIIAIDTADFNNDGNLDIVGAVQGGDAIAIFLGDGTGSFAINEIPAGDGPNDIGTGDFNEDGNPDVVVTSRFSDDIYFFLGDGTGGMNAPDIIPANPNVRCLTLGDFNNDNNLDLLVGANTDLDFYAGDGSGNLASAVTTSGFFGTRIINAADFDGNGNLDVFVSESTFSYRIRGQGDGTFVNAGAFNEGQQNNTFGDFNNDGNVDFVSQNNSRVMFYPGNGLGGFPNYRRTYIGNGGFAIASGDWNNDGHLDVAVAGGGAVDNVTITYGDGNGYFSGPTEYTLFPTTFAFEKADLNNDGELDLIAGSAGDMNIYLGDGQGRFNFFIGLNVGTAREMRALHINSDSFIDLVALDIATDQVRVFAGDGTGFLADVGAFGVTAEQNMTVGDVNKDNITDIVLSGAGGNIQVFRGNGNQTFTMIQDLTVGEFVWDALVEDINKDTNPDLIYVVDPTAGPNQARIFQGDGAGNFTPAGTPLDLTIGGRTLYSGDVNNDGDVDFVTTGNGADASILVGDGTFNFNINTRSGAVGSATEAIFADINGDGNEDVVIGSSIGGFAIYLGAGDGTFPTYDYRLLGAGGFKILPDDFNNDGIIDLATITSGGSPDALGVHLNNTIPPACTPAQVTAGPGSATFCVGETRVLTVTASGDLPISYQWQKDGSDIVGATSATLSLTNVVIGDAGSYVCNITNACGTDSSTPSVITILEPVQITTQPQSITVDEDDQVTFTVVASGDNLSYLWQLNGSGITGAVSDTYTIGAASFSDEGTYTCLVSNSCSSELSAGATLTINTGGTGFSVIDIQGNVTLSNGQTNAVDLGQTAPGNPITREFDIENTSASILNVTDITSSNQDFVVMDIPTMVDPATTEFFTVEFSSNTPGVSSSNIRILTDAGNFVFPIEAEVTDLPGGQLVIYNALAPDGDGRNDYFRIENIENFSNNRVRIYNRWGKLVFEISGYNNQSSSQRFEGRSNEGGSRDLLEGTYFYVIEVDGDRLSGDLFLRR